MKKIKLMKKEVKAQIDALSGNDKVLARVYLKRAYKKTYALKFMQLLID